MKFFFGVKEFFSLIITPKIGVKMNLFIKTKNYPSYLVIGILGKSISKLFGRAMAMPSAWELRS